MKKVPVKKPLCPPGRRPRFEDVPFATVPLSAGGSCVLNMDIYQDLNQKEPGPCIVYYFGGGWLWGEYKQVTQRAVYIRELIRLVEKGYTIVSPAYRLASQAPFPACIHDSKGVIRFLKANAEKYHIDPERIGVFGNSAGGHLAAMVAMSSKDPEMEGEAGGNLEFTSKVKAAAIYYAPADILEMLEEGLAEERKENDLTGTEVGNKGFNFDEHWSYILGWPDKSVFLSRFKELLSVNDKSDPDWKYIEIAKSSSPINYVGSDCPPMIILHGGQDPVVPIKQSEKLYRSLADAGAEVMYLSYSLAGHGPTLGREADNMAFQFLMKRL